MNVLDLFDTLHPAPSWGAWRAFVAACYGLPLTPEELATFQRHTGRQTPREGGFPEAVLVCGVQSGKSSVAGCLADHAALTGEKGTHAVLVGQDARAAMRALFAFASQPFKEIPAFRAELSGETVSTLSLSRGTFIDTFPCRPAALRGLRANIVCVDELAHFVSTDGRPTDTEMMRVSRGRTATTHGKVVILSSPYAMSGQLYELHRRHYGKEDSETLIWQASAPEMNPALSADYLARMEKEDPDAFASEVMGQFRPGLSTFLDPDALAEVTEHGVRERPPLAEVNYIAFADAASGSGKDSFALAVAHKDGERGVLDVCQAWSPPFSPSSVIAEACGVLGRFGVSKINCDRYAPGFVEDGFQKHGITYQQSPRNTSANYLEFLPLINSGAVVVLDQPALLRELRGLERRRGTGGRDRVDHKPGSHDDRAVACAGSLVLASARTRKCCPVWGRSYAPAQPEPRRDTGRELLDRLRAGLPA